MHLYRRIDGTDFRGRATADRADGTYGTRLRLRSAGSRSSRAPAFLSRAASRCSWSPRSPEAPHQARLKARVTGTAVVGHHRLFLRGRLRPAAANVLTRCAVRCGGVSRSASAARSSSRLRTKAPTRSGFVWLHPDAGYRPLEDEEAEARPSLPRHGLERAVRPRARASPEPAVRAASVGAYYGDDTAQAVLAFKKVHGLSRTGRTTPDVWRRLTRSKTPRSRVPKGNHIEISKTHQVIYEVRKGKVVNVIHTSTGATGNTPVGEWRVYGKVPGYNASHMYYSLFFLRGFAIHGYHSVPPWPASHGCSRIPLWIAPGLYSRWGYGSRIIVFLTRDGAVYPQRMDDASSDPVVRQIRDQISTTTARSSKRSTSACSWSRASGSTRPRAATRCRTPSARAGCSSTSSARTEAAHRRGAR